MARYIDADILRGKIVNIISYCQKDKAVGSLNALNSVLEALIDTPTTDVQSVVHGEWKEVYDTDSQDYNSDNNWWLRCSCCQSHVKISFRKQRFDYCPNCGAKMDGGDTK